MELLYAILFLSLLTSMNVALWVAIAAWTTWMLTHWWAFLFRS